MRVSAALILSCAAGTYAWGEKAHQATGRIAQGFINKCAQKEVFGLIPENNSDIGIAATWADTVKFTPEFAFSFGLHFIDSHDNTPIDQGKTSCTVDLLRDCANGQCIVKAISNYTEQLDPENNFPLKQRQEAFKFLAHFFGDVTFQGETLAPAFPDPSKPRTTPFQLHGLWDFIIPETDMAVNFNGSIAGYADDLVKRLSVGGDLRKSRHSWTTCKEPYVTKSGKKISVCPLEYSTSANVINCDTVWSGFSVRPDGKGTEDDLGFSYNDRVAPLIRKQIAMAGYRF
ncbi:phospholipase C/P1 nuclease domain-containing protein, partial [Blyttiomyces helicus]